MLVWNDLWVVKMAESCRFLAGMRHLLGSVGGSYIIEGVKLNMASPICNVHTRRGG